MRPLKVKDDEDLSENIEDVGDHVVHHIEGMVQNAVLLPGQFSSVQIQFIQIILPPGQDGGANTKNGVDY